MSSFEEYIASLKRKNQNLHNENTNLWAEVKRLTDELDREKLNKNREFFARMRAENARKNLEELFRKKSAETECLRADLEAKVVENQILRDSNKNQLQVNNQSWLFVEISHPTKKIPIPRIKNSREIPKVKNPEIKKNLISLLSKLKKNRG